MNVRSEILAFLMEDGTLPPVKDEVEALRKIEEYKKIHEKRNNHYRGAVF